VKNFSFEFLNSTQLASNLNNVASWAQRNNISKIWIQVYVVDEEGNSFQPIIDTISLCLPDAQYVITHAGMAFSSGNVAKTNALVVCNLFEDPTTQIEVYQYKFGPADYEKTVDEIIDYVQKNPWIKLISFNTGASLEGIQYMNKMAQAIDSKIVVSGGAAATATMSYPAKVYSPVGELSTSDLIVTYLGGENFHARADVMVGWKGIGKEFTVTKSEGPVLYEVDGKPAFDLYRKYFKINTPPGMVVAQTIEFPFCYEHGGFFFLRCPFILNEDGSIVMMLNDLKVGQKIRLSFGSPEVILEEIASKLNQIAEFEPQAISVNSCLGRSFFWGGNITNELSLFPKVATTNGFLTGGEILRSGDRMLIFNETIIATSMREGEKSVDGSGVHKVIRNHNDFSLTQRLSTFIDTVTSDLQEYNETMKTMAITDSLTGLNNRREVENVIQSLTSAEKPFSLLMIDADNFKKINDNYGHAEGDKVLCYLAEVIRSIMAADNGSITAGRWGGDEFLVVVEEGSKEKAIWCAEELQKRYHSDSAYEGFSRTLSIGIAHADTSEERDNIFQKVDEQLYQAKSKGKGCIIF